MIIELSGEAMMHNAQKARELFLSVTQGDCGTCSIDISRTETIDISFVGLLLSFARTMESLGKKASFVPLPDGSVIASFLEQSGTAKLLYPENGGANGL